MNVRKAVREQLDELDRAMELLKKANPRSERLLASVCRNG